MPKITKLCLHLLKLYGKKPWPLFSGDGVESFADISVAYWVRLFSLKQAVQGHPRSLILVPVESAYATSVMVALVLSCHVSVIGLLQVFCSETDPPHIFHHNFGSVPFGPDRRCWDRSQRRCRPTMSCFSGILNVTFYELRHCLRQNHLHLPVALYCTKS